MASPRRGPAQPSPAHCAPSSLFNVQIRFLTSLNLACPSASRADEERSLERRKSAASVVRASREGGAGRGAVQSGDGSGGR
jgi:hypothetical protein